jgi:protein-tyrosine kinase
MNTMSDLSAIEDLVTRIDAQLNTSAGRVIGFIASGSGEGTTTLANAYASAVVSRLRRRVLVLGVASENSAVPGVLPLLAAGSPLDAALQPLPGGGFSGNLDDSKAGEGKWDLLARADLWQQLREHFDEIVLDLPATSKLRLGLVCAVHCDGVVVVLEAEKTRAPVVENLISSLRAVRAPILGTVLNQRQFYLPQRIYRWL